MTPAYQVKLILLLLTELQLMADGKVIVTDEDRAEVFFVSKFL